MTSTATFAPAGSDFDRAQHIDDSDRGAGLDTAALQPPHERVRAAIDAATLADRFDQAWITPLDLDDDYDYARD
ncbi:hypothetical protein [Nocardia sp. CA-145437]|uniref:hypothetical protein n=1 Tax=Nocardia sp. CA-145437 TaxID=3239980 RepID=UPI003D99C87D